MNFRSPTWLTVIGIGATLVLTTAVVAVLFWFGDGGKAVSDNAALIGALIALGGVLTTQLVNSALEAQRAQQARKTEQAQRGRDRKTEQAQRERELHVVSQRAQDDAAQAYLDQMSNLLLDKDKPLRHSEDDAEVRTLARARTLTVLSRLDGVRRGNVVQFLYESHLINKERSLVDLEGAELGGANLINAELISAKLTRTHLNGATLNDAILRSTLFIYAYLVSAKLVGADLRGAKFIHADLSGADLSGAKLGGADLREANLREANLDGAVSWTEDQLLKAKSLEGATMPNGQKYEDWLKDKEADRQDGEHSNLS